MVVDHIYGIHQYYHRNEKVRYVDVSLEIKIFVKMRCYFKMCVRMFLNTSDICFDQKKKGDDDL
jgi:hypothetical protein